MSPSPSHDVLVDHPGLHARPSPRALAIIAVGLTILTAGCGDETARVAAPVADLDGAEVALTVAWPALISERTASGEGRPSSGEELATSDAERVSSDAQGYLPAYTQSLDLTMQHEDDPETRFSLVANRPDAGASVATVRFPDRVPAGSYVLTGVARSGRDADGTSVAEGDASFEVEDGDHLDVDLELRSTLTSLEILGTPLRVPLGYRHQVVTRARDVEDQWFTIPGGALSWTIEGEPSVASIDPGGRLIASSPGSITLAAEEVGAELTSSTTVEVAPWPEPGQIWIASFQSPSRLGWLDLDDGIAFHEVGSTYFEGSRVLFADIAWSPGPDRTLYGVDDANRIFTIEIADPPVLRQVGTLPGFANSLACSVDGRLLAAGPGTKAGSGVFYEVELASGAARVVSTFDGAPMGDMDVSPDDGLLYLTVEHLDLSRRILRLDPRTGETSDFTALDAWCAATAYTGRGYYAVTWTEDVLEVDLTTGEVTRVGSVVGIGSVGGASAVLP